MPSTTKHLDRARRHLAAADAASSSPESRSWAAVALAYAAHQLLHAIFDCADGLTEPERHPENHTSQVLNNPGTNYVVRRRFQSVSTSYDDLYAVSRGVRYNGEHITPELWDELRNGDFLDVAAWANAELLKASRSTPEWLALEAARLSS